MTDVAIPNDPDWIPDEYIEPPAELASARAKRQSKSDLPSPPPPGGADGNELRGWLTVALALGCDPIAAIKRYGRHDDARLVVTLGSGGRIVYERQREIFNADDLVRRVVLSAGVNAPSYKKADAQHIARVLVRAADLVAEDDDRAEAREWARSFLESAQALEGHDLSTPVGRYAGLCALRDHRHENPQPWMEVADRSAVLLDSAGRRWVKTGQFGAHVRSKERKPIAWPTINSRMVEVGWVGSEEYEQRQPRGEGRVKLHAYVVPPAWDDDIDSEATE